MHAEPINIQHVVRFIQNLHRTYCFVTGMICVFDLTAGPADQRITQFSGQRIPEPCVGPNDTGDFAQIARLRSICGDFDPDRNTDKENGLSLGGILTGDSVWTTVARLGIIGANRTEHSSLPTTQRLKSSDSGSGSDCSMNPSEVATPSSKSLSTAICISSPTFFNQRLSGPNCA